MTGHDFAFCRPYLLQQAAAPVIVPLCLQLEAVLMMLCCLPVLTVTHAWLGLQEMFVNLRRGLDNELDNITTVLAKRSGEVCSQYQHFGLQAQEALVMIAKSIDSSCSFHCVNMRDCRCPAVIKGDSYLTWMHSVLYIPDF